MNNVIKDWKKLFDKVAGEEYSASLHRFLDAEYEAHVIYPPRDMMFQAFKFTNPSTLKVVVIGQDPYHNPGEAMGMSFSVPRGIDIPPSLINIYKEIEKDIGCKMNFDNGDLTPWAEQGVLLLNAYLSVRAGIPLSHVRPEYDKFMDASSWTMFLSMSRALISQSSTCFGEASRRSTPQRSRTQNTSFFHLFTRHLFPPIGEGGLDSTFSASATPI